MAKPTIETKNWTNGEVAKVTEPDQSKKNTGFVFREEPPFQFINWLFYAILSWTQWLYDIDVDQGTDNTSWNINKGANVTNQGSNINTINCDFMDIDVTCSKGNLRDSEYMDMENIENFEVINSQFVEFNSDNSDNIIVKNSNNLTVGDFGTDCDNIEIENSFLVNIAGSRNGVKNCSSITIGSNISNSFLEGISNFIETKSNTKTVNNHRVIGSKIVKQVIPSTLMERLGIATQKIFANRYKSQQADKYWPCEDANWRKALQGGSELAGFDIVGGVQVVSDTLSVFGSSSSSNSATEKIEYPVDSVTSLDPTQNNVFSTWIYLLIVDTTNVAVCRMVYDDDVATGNYGWVISKSSDGEYRVANLDSSSTLSLGALPENEFINLCVVWNYDKRRFMFYIDSEYKGSLSVLTPSLGVGYFRFIAGQWNTFDAIGIIYVAETSFFNNTLFDGYDIKKLYSGGVQLSLPNSSLFLNAKLSSIHLIDSSNKQIQEPNIIGDDDDEFVYLEFPKFMKNRLHSMQTKIEVFSEKYELE